MQQKDNMLDVAYQIAVKFYELLGLPLSHTSFFDELYEVRKGRDSTTLILPLHRVREFRSSGGRPPYNFGETVWAAVEAVTTVIEGKGCIPTYHAPINNEMRIQFRERLPQREAA